MTHLLLSLLLLQAAPDPTSATLKETTVAIARAATNADRRTTITERLKSAGITFQVQEFTSNNRTGSNVVATLPGKTGSPVLLLGAHLDRVAVGQGALDNAASCAVLLQLLTRLKATPLPNTTVTAVFFDLEEEGLLGSSAYLTGKKGEALPARAINLDIFGYGDTLFVTGTKEDGALFAAVKQASADASIPFLNLPMTQYPSSDHQSMASAGIETLGVAIVSGVEILSALVGGTPRILSLIHTENDTIEHIRSDDMAKGASVLERAIRALQ